MTIRAILFDFGQTLVDSADGFRTAEKQAQTKIFADLSLRSWDQFLAEYRRFRADYHERSNFSRSAFWQALYAHYGRTPSRDFLAHAERDYWRTVRGKTLPFAETQSVLKQLAPRYRLALITNSQGEARSRRHRLDLFPWMEHFLAVVIVAGEGGIPPKPSPEPFHLCLEALGIAASEAVYVGDDWRIDVCGAQAVGIQPVWLQHEAVPRNWPKVETSVPIITSLAQLPGVIEGAFSPGPAT
jgi:HAD superfamily hydrolase (TIGR01549 family)